MTQKLFNVSLLYPQIKIVKGKKCKTNQEKTKTSLWQIVGTPFSVKQPIYLKIMHMFQGKLRVC